KKSRDVAVDGLPSAQRERETALGDADACAGGSTGAGLLPCRRPFRDQSRHFGKAYSHRLWRPTAGARSFPTRSVCVKSARRSAIGPSPVSDAFGVGL